MNMAMCYTEVKSREVKGRWYDMTDNMRDIILRFSQQVKMIMGSKLDKVILYGSYARGDYNEHSDRFGIEPCGKHPIYRRSNPVMRLRMAGLEGVLGEGENHKRGIRRQKRRFHQIGRRLNRDGN